MTKLRLPAPAKINLFLKVLNKREDNYHNLQTLFHFLEYYDYLTFELQEESEAIGLVCEKNELVNEDNLIIKAARLLKAHALEQTTADLPGVTIHLDKNLPMGGGVGGGSSDAATCLLAMNKLWELNFSLEELAELSLQLGSDVPVFVLGNSALGEGRGEHLKVFDLPEFYYLLIKPACHVETAEIFRHEELTRDSSPRTIRAFLNGGGQDTQAFQGLEELIHIGNDCQNLARKLYPEIDQALALLSEFSYAQLTGTGACVFAAFETRGSAEKAYHALSEGTKTNPVIEHMVLVKGLNRSPVHQLLAS
jgi:4-diphosphocytidyl-2-C-methyl-D-erythritol kinase